MKSLINKINLTTLALIAVNYALCRTDGNYTWFYISLIGVPFVVHSTVQTYKAGK
jgi:hypothetical protein